MITQPKSLFISHGGGPMPLLGDEAHQEMVSCLKNIAASIPRPSAIVVASAHWEEILPTITAVDQPSLIYDYYGFPDESYKIQYPCAGDASLANRLQQQLLDTGIEAKLDDERGLDHGVFVPLKIMYPDASIPCVQLSLLKSLNPSAHIEMGKTLQSLSDDNILLIGSGFSFHNLPAFFKDSAESQQLNQAFEDWLLTTCSSTDITEQQRTEQLRDWFDAPGARFCHPREEHLLPLHLCYGAAQSPCSESFELNIMNRQSSMYLW